MKIGKKSYFIGLLVILFSILGVILLKGTTQIKASEEPMSEQAQDLEQNSSSLPKTKADLHNQDIITIPQMESYMDGTNYLSPQERTGDKITGAMTADEYKLRYEMLNAQQNEAWNTKYNFRPELNVKRVGTLEEFRVAYNDNAVSKIELTANISTSGTTNAPTLSRTESIEIDGKGNSLYLRNGSLNVDDLASLASFKGAFSDAPVFHMHDIEPSNATSAGAAEAAPHWAFVNGSGSLAANTGRRFWQYRIGNIHTPTGAMTTNGNSLIAGRLIGGNQANISLWGHNEIVSAAENFYTGGLDVEPYTYYKGAIARYNYSTVWFIRDPKTSVDSTGTGKFLIGEGAFVYLNNTGSGTTYPGTYEWYDEINVGKNATYNVNVPGVAVEFNVNNGKFIANEGSTVNLLSRAGSRPTLSAGSFISTHGSTQNPSNVSYEFKPKSNLFVIGSNSGGVVGYNSTNGGHKIELNGLESFDIRNTYGGTSTNNAFLQDQTTASTRGTNSFVIRNSDISTWNNAADIDGAPTYDYSNVGDFTVTTAVANGAVTSSDNDLQNQYNRPGFKRISGMNSIPELTWTPVTDADLNQRTQVLIGYTAVGGTEPFDENGDAKVKPVYADSVRKAYVDYIDTLGNTYVGISSNDTYVNWKSVDHAIAGFQIAKQDMFGTPYRASIVNNVLTPYNTGEKIATTVIDITPPEPAIVTGDKVTNGTKQLIGKDAEPKAKIYVDINGVRQTTVGTVNDDGTWSYNLPRYLNTGEIVQIFLEDNADEITEKLDPAVPVTNSANGNINPATELKYRDAVFKAATKYTVEDGIPDNPLMEKKVVSTGDKTTQVGDILTYTLKATNGKNASLDAVWNTVTIKDTIPEGLKFDPATATVTINGTAAAETDFTYDVDSRLLTVNVGNLKAGESATVTFKTEVEQSAVGKVINNVGTATGFSPRESGEFIEGPDDPNRAHDVFAKDANVDNPGGSIFGILELVSAPKNINFGTTKFSPKGTNINNPSYEGGDLVVKDGRAVQETWTLNARLDKELAKVGEPQTFIPRAIRYVHQNDEITLMGASQPIVSRKNANNDPYNISGTWSPDGDGFKLKVESGQSIDAGKYEATIVWELVAGPPPANP